MATVVPVIAPLLLPLLLAHPGHGAPETPWCVPPPRVKLYCPAEPPEEIGGSQVEVARRVMERGGATIAARMVAREAERSPEAAELLAQALERLGDPLGAAHVRARVAGSPLP